jgi:hypothetical protein
MDISTLDHLASIASGLCAVAGMLLNLTDRRRRRQDESRP